MGLPTPPESCAVPTPPPLASALVRALGQEPASTWLEPCVGNGAFLRALSDLGVDSSQIVAVDIEPTPTAQDALAQTLRGVDFLAWSRTTTRRFDKIVANPPYVPIGKVDPVLQQSALAVATPDGHFVPRGSNYWCAFLCASLALLRPGGDLGFVLPAAWDYADYAASLRDSIIHRFARFEVHRSLTPMFDSVQDGCVVIIARGFDEPTTGVTRHEHNSADALVSALQDARSGPTGTVPAFSGTPSLTRALPQPVRRLGDVVSIRLGGVTGDAPYFLLTESERLQRKLPVKSLRPVVSKARHLVAGELTPRSWRSLRAKDERVWLFDPPPSVVGHPAVQAYLSLPPSSGGCRRDRRKIANRSPWYRTPLPKRVDGFLSGMTQLLPWICLRAMPRLTATNTLYSVTFHGSPTKDEKAAWALSLLTSHSRHFLQTVGRVYPEGLVKYEPRDLLDVPALVPATMRGSRVHYLKAVAALLSGEVEKARQMADEWFGLL
jgi:adenine-specific DNA-methyltransferase